MGTALEDIATERRRQIEVEGFDHDHDNAHKAGEMGMAAAAYAINCNGDWSLAEIVWPWSREWWKPETRRRDLVKAGALIIAEIERIDRFALASASSPREGQ